MIIAATKVFADFINKTAIDLNFKCEATLVHLPESAYEFYTGINLWDGERDYDYKRGDYKVIAIAYPPEYYACPRYLTTYELNREYHRRGCKYLEDVQAMLKDMLEI